LTAGTAPSNGSPGYAAMLILVRAASLAAPSTSPHRQRQSLIVSRQDATSMLPRASAAAALGRQRECDATAGTVSGTIIGIVSATASGGSGVSAR